MLVEEANKKTKGRASIAVLLSLFSPGLGQVYNDEPGRAAILVLGFCLATLFIRSPAPVTLGPWGLGVGYAIFGILYLAAIVDAGWRASRPRFFGRAIVISCLAFYFIVNPVIYLSLRLTKTIAASDLYSVPSSSMAPALPAGDTIVADLRRFVPRAGEVVIFRYPRDENIVYIKRIVGLPGDAIQIKGGKVYVNEKLLPQNPSEEIYAGTGEDLGALSLLEENLGGHTYKILRAREATPLSDFGPATVLPGSYFVLGDNRDRSSDSRIWGFVPAAKILGRPAYVAYSFDEAGGLSFARSGLAVK
ncbi:MAG: signal peptidase I [Proteobacteria bacterium]|nr:MAG: signal peptidase I [Pseudomonadota bacterium]